MPTRIARVLFTEAQIRERVRELAAQIQRDLEGKDLLIIAVLRGSMVFLADLIRFLPMPLRIEVIRAASYGQSTVSSGVVNIRDDMDVTIQNRDVLLLDDILDTGRTLARIREHIQSYGPRTLRTCVLLDKPSRRVVPLEPDYCGFRIDDHFVVGYGLDYRDTMRNLPYIGILDDDVTPGPVKP